MDVGIFFEENVFKLKIEDGDLVSDEGLETAVMISLFSDKRVSEEELPTGITDRAGWWGDMFAEPATDRTGSKIWTVLNRGKATDENIALLETEVYDSLKWMVEDGVAESVIAFAELDDDGIVQFGADILKPGEAESNRFGFLWDGQELRRGSV